MIFTIEPIVLVWLLGLALAVLGGFAGIGRWLLAQYQKRIDDRFHLLAEDARAWRQAERNLMDLRAHVTENYVMRDDYTRNQSVVEAKLDALAAKIELLQAQAAPARNPNGH
ncbi:MAG TPA: hypothetical protein VFN09_04885 [Rhodanobacteraceae bacterium]|nr:hypothetical protein [Rhodanobacteraceae bacterium]